MLWIRKTHKWLSVIVGIQFLLWLVSGLYFNTMDHDEAAGHTYRSHQQVNNTVDNTKLIEPKDVLAKSKAAVSFNLTYILEKPYYKLTHKAGMYRHFENHYSLVNAYTGAPFEIDEKTARTIASNSYSGDHGIIKASLLLPEYEASAEQSLILTRGPSEDLPKEKNALWRIDFDNDINTSVYVEVGSGRLVGHSDDNKRFADIFFMLHFMDYGNHGKFNSLQMMLFAFFTLFVALTGVIWTVDLALKGHYKLNRKV